MQQVVVEVRGQGRTLIESRLIPDQWDRMEAARQARNEQIRSITFSGQSGGTSHRRGRCF